MRTGLKRPVEGGFSLVEVLVATFILTLVIMTVSLCCKQFFATQARLQRMENIYLSTLSLKDRIEIRPLEGGMTEEGSINGLAYRYTVRRLTEKSNHGNGAGRAGTENQGPFRLQLLKVELQVAGRGYEFLTTAVENSQTFARDRR